MSKSAGFCSIYNRLLDETHSVASGRSADQYLFTISLLRSVLQTAAFSAFELAATRSHDDDLVLPDIARGLAVHSDGQLVNLVGQSLAVLRTLGWSNCVASWSQGSHGGVQALRERFFKWAKHRNDFPGHGVPSKQAIREALDWLPDLARDAVAGLADVLPGHVPGDLQPSRLESPLGAIDVDLVRTWDGSPLVVREVSSAGSAYRVKYQALDPEQMVTGTFELSLDSPLVFRSNTSPNFFFNVRWSPEETKSSLVHVPRRQTSETAFAGRDAELLRLREWMNDGESRACLVYGQGGVGKTTLVLEFLNRWLEGREDVAWKPEIIAYYTAKQTRWQPGGMIEIKGISPNVAEAVRMIPRSLTPVLESTWYERDDVGTITAVSNWLRDFDINKKNVLLVIDNAETLIGSRDDEKALSRLLKQMSQHVARILITSRRHELLEAAPIEVEPLTDRDGAEVIRRLARAYSVTVLQDVDEKRLSQLSREFGGRPLLLDCFVRMLDRYSQSIDQAVRRVRMAAEHDLGLFLYDDAWQRLTRPFRNVFLVVAYAGGVLNGDDVAWVCAACEATYIDFADVLTETRLGNVLQFGMSEEFRLELSGRAFVLNRLRQMRESKDPDIARVEDINRELKKRLEKLSEDGSEPVDRIAQAFRTKEAKLALRHVREHEFEEALIWYEEAIRVDSKNSALFHRFARFAVIDLKDPERAYKLAVEACRLDDMSAEAHFVRGLVALRREDFAEARAAFSRARALGKPEHVCDLQLARTYIRFIERRATSAANARALTKDVEDAKRLLAAAALLRIETHHDRRHAMERRTACVQLEKLEGRLAEFKERADRLVAEEAKEKATSYSTGKRKS